MSQNRRGSTFVKVEPLLLALSCSTAQDNSVTLGRPEHTEETRLEKDVLHKSPARSNVIDAGFNEHEAVSGRLSPSVRRIAKAWPGLSQTHRQAILKVIDDPRQHDGIEIAATKAITQAGDVWLVPSQSGKEVYRVRLDALPARCSCTDSMTRKIKCKHIWAAEMARARS